MASQYSNSIHSLTRNLPKYNVLFAAEGSRDEAITALKQILNLTPQFAWLQATKVTRDLQIKLLTSPKATVAENLVLSQFGFSIKLVPFGVFSSSTTALYNNQNSAMEVKPQTFFYLYIVKDN